MNKDTLLEWLDKATTLELNEVVKAIEEKFGVSAAAVAAAGPANGGGAAPAAEEKDAFTVVLASAGEQKIAVMKAVKEVLGLGLKDAKDLVDGAPVTLKEGMKKAEADDFKIWASGGTAKHLKDAGVSVEDVVNLVGARLPDGQGGAIFGHRVVTLSREIHAGLLAKDNKEDREELQKLKIPFIDLVCVDLYPLEEEIKNPGATRESVIEKTDIGGRSRLGGAPPGATSGF